jgi:hypothetical protein
MAAQTSFQPAPWTAAQMLDAYFLETRARLLEVAANLDRFDRASDAPTHAHDPRLIFIQKSLAILQSSAPNRAEQIQRLYSKD